MLDLLKRQFVVLGGGGHGAVVADLLQAIGCDILGVADPSKAAGVEVLPTVRVVASDEEIMAMGADAVYLAMGLGSIKSNHTRAQVFNRFEAAGFVFPPLVHPTATIAQSCVIGAGSQIMAGAVVQARTAIGRNSIVNTRSSVDHDCKIGNHVHIAPGAILSGGVRVADGAHVGTGATVIQSIVIGSAAVVGAGVSVLRNVPENTVIRAYETSVWCNDQ